MAGSISTASKLDGLSSKNSCGEEYADNESDQDKSADGSNLSSDENANSCSDKYTDNESNQDENAVSSDRDADSSDHNGKLDGPSSENSSRQIMSRTKKNP